MRQGRKSKCLLLLFFLIVFHLLLNIVLKYGYNSPGIPLTPDDTTEYPKLAVQHIINERNGVSSVYYRSSSDENYQYEFRYELNVPLKNDEHRLMIILYCSKSGCGDIWNIPLSDSILSALHNFNYSILAICSKRKSYDTDLPLKYNKDIKYVYSSLQIWMNTIYYARFQRYPLLYIHATSHSSSFASLLCRILPVQSIIFNAYTGNQETMLIPSDYDNDMQTRLTLDPAFANWFYFYFCYNISFIDEENRRFCPLERTDHNYLYPVPPCFFTFLQKNPYQNSGSTIKFITDIRNNSFRLGNKLLTHADALQFDFLSPVNLNVSYIQKQFHFWTSKPYAVQLFVKHFTDTVQYHTDNIQRRTCWCSTIDFQYFEMMPNVTKTWFSKMQLEYDEYVKDIRIFHNAFCEIVCGDLMALHSIMSQNINYTLIWITQMDILRHSFYLDDYLKRPLRIWMYDKNVLIPKVTYFSCGEANWANISQEYQMYSPEFYLQEYFKRMSMNKNISRRYLKWATNPLLADYFIIPCDVMFYYFCNQPSTLPEYKFKNLHRQLNNYFEILFTHVRTLFPYWKLTAQEDQIGANHILIMPGGRNMGILYNKTRNMLRNVIQLAFTGVRQDLLPRNALSPYSHRNIYIVYRHQYDVIIPQGLPLKWERSKLVNLDALVKTKERLCFFAGALQHTTSSVGGRSILASLWREMQKKTKEERTILIQEKEYEILHVISGHTSHRKYVNWIQSSVFAVCPEGFLPWSPRIYESIQYGAIPLILANNIVLPFERFIDWRSFSVKLDTTHFKNITRSVYQIENFEKYIRQKLENATSHLDSFRWPYFVANKVSFRQHIFDPQQDLNGQTENAFHYISLELRCRRLEQFYGFTVDRFTTKSIEAQQLACTNHPTICPCHDEKRSVAFQEYF